MARKNRKAAKKASSSMLLLLIIAAAILAFLPFRLTLAAGTTGANSICNLLKLSSSDSGCGGLFALTGTHITVDALGVLLNNSFPALSSALSSLGPGFLGLKAQRTTVDIASQNGTAITGLLPPIGTSGNPTTTTTCGTAPCGRTLEIKLVMLSVTISGYSAPSSTLNKYGETNLAALNPALMISLDRVILDLFIDPFTSIATYIVSADMTVYQGLALLLQTATL